MAMIEQKLEQMGVQLKELAPSIYPILRTKQAGNMLYVSGHPSEILHLATEKAKIKLDTPTGGIIGEKPMWVESGEASTVENTREYYPGLFACGMSANNVMGGYRMGPIFGGMLMSGRKAARLIAEKFGK